MQKLVYDGLQRCPYLPGRIARMPLYRQLRRLTLDEADERFANAERRVGVCLYRTACPTCSACEGIRIPVDEFRPSRSQRRVLKRWGDRFRIEMGTPTVSPAKLAMFNAHKQERGLVTREDSEMTDRGYSSWLVHTCFHTAEMRYYLESEGQERLVGIGVVDFGRRALSSVYFYFDPSPATSRLSPGVFSVLQEIELCRRTGREWLYLGLHVADCRPLAYKATYFPHEHLYDGDWRRRER